MKTLTIIAAVALAAAFSLATGANSAPECYPAISASQCSPSQWNPCREVGVPTEYELALEDDGNDLVHVCHVTQCTNVFTGSTTKVDYEKEACRIVGPMGGGGPWCLPEFGDWCPDFPDEP